MVYYKFEDRNDGLLEKEKKNREGVRAKRTNRAKPKGKIANIKPGRNATVHTTSFYYSSSGPSVH